MTLRIAPIGPTDEVALVALFARVAADPACSKFHPHPFTPEEAARRSAYRGGDLYALMSHGDEAVGYGLLRGWDEGFAIPSLGIFIAETHRRVGAARTLMSYLHLSARLKRAPAVRLKVYPDNTRALRLYESLGYRFSPKTEQGQLVGLLELA